MMIVSLKLIPISDQRESILRVLHSVVPATLSKPGCLNCGVFEEYDADHLILYSEQWQTEEELHQHIRSVQFLRILTAMDLAKDPPQISFHQVSKSEHLELIQALRGECPHA